MDNVLCYIWIWLILFGEAFFISLNWIWKWPQNLSDRLDRYVCVCMDTQTQFFILQSIELTETKLTLTSSTPALIRITPSFLYTVSMTTNMLLEQCTGYTQRGPIEKNRQLSLVLAPYIIINKTTVALNIGQVSYT